MRFLHSSWALIAGVCAMSSSLAFAACGTSNPSDVEGPGPDGSVGLDAGGSALPSDDAGSTSASGGDGASASTHDGGGHHDAGASSPSSDATAPNPDGGYPAGWLYTAGGKIYVSNGSSPGTQWMGRGVNIDDLYFCGYDNTLWMTNPDQLIETIVKTMMTSWKPTFFRTSLSMNSFPKVSSWTGAATPYKGPMTNVINAMTGDAGVHVLVTVRSDGSMLEDLTAQTPDATGLPTDSTTTPNATSFPTGTDATYVALVDTFANNGGVLIGLSNEPGGSSLSDAAISAAMSHAVGVIRAEEDKLGVPHHVVSVQGNKYTSDISMYAKTPLPYDNVVYEVHGYPPAATSYTYTNIPVIIGEYGSLTSSASFYDDLEAKQISNLAWDFDPYNDCAPDLLNVNMSTTNLVASTWGATVQAYLLAH